MKLCFMLDAHRLRLLAEVARCGSITAAADRLQFSPSAVSQQIAVLEREAGATLLERRGRGVTLTEPGRVLVAHAERVVAQLHAAQDELQALAGARGGLVRLAFFTTAGAVLVPRAIAAFSARHPDVEVRLVHADPDDALTMLAAHQLELALIYEHPFESFAAAGVEQEDLLDDEVVVILPTNHPLTAQPRLRLAELADQTWVQGVVSGATTSVLPTACRRAGFEPQIAFASADHMTVQGLAAAGVGLALTSQLSLPTLRDDLAVRSLEGRDAGRDVRLARPIARHRPPAADTLADILRAEARAILHEAHARAARS